MFIESHCHLTIPELASQLPQILDAMAQAQVEKGWGAIELKDETGHVVAVFIPAGHATFISGSNTLYPILSK